MVSLSRFFTTEEKRQHKEHRDIFAHYDGPYLRDRRSVSAVCVYASYATDGLCLRELGDPIPPHLGPFFPHRL